MRRLYYEHRDPPEDPIEFQVERMDLGMIPDENNRDAPPESGSSMNAVRFENRGVRKDYGRVLLGAGAPGAILGMIEHRYFFENQVRHRLVRLSQLGTTLRLDVWNGLDWELGGTYHEIEDEYLSVVSLQNTLVMADGKRILKWDEDFEEVPQGHNWPAATEILNGTCSPPLVVNPALAVADRYVLHFDMVWTNVPSDETARVELVLNHNGLEFDRIIVTHTPGMAPPPTTTTSHEYEFFRHIDADDTIELCIDAGESTGVGEIITVNLVDGDTLQDGILGGPDFWVRMWSGYKTWATGGGAAVTRDYEIKYTTRIAPGKTLQVMLLMVADRGSGPETVHQSFFNYPLNLGSEDEVLERTHVVSITDVPLGTSVVVAPQQTDPNPGDPGNADWYTNEPGAKKPIEGPVTFSMVPLGTEPEVEWKAVPHHDGTNPTRALTYMVQSGNVTTDIRLLSVDAPGGRFIFPFGDRLISLRDHNNAQTIGASADGLIETWNGDDTYLADQVDTPSDSIDDLMGGAQLSAGVAAVFRRRSIGRMFESGNTELPIAVVKWIEKLGTESPFSIQLVDRGIAFLGHDKMVYILTEGGHVPVSLHLHDYLKERIPNEDLEYVDSAYNDVTGEYFLGIPAPGVLRLMDEVIIFDVKRFWNSNQQEAVWRSRIVDIERLASVSRLV